MWRVTSINNQTHTITTTHKYGYKLSFVIPESHRSSPELKWGYVKSRTKAHDLRKLRKDRIFYLVGGLILLTSVILLFR